MESSPYGLNCPGSAMVVLPKLCSTAQSSRVQRTDPCNTNLSKYHGISEMLKFKHSLNTKELDSYRARRDVHMLNLNPTEFIITYILIDEDDCYVITICECLESFLDVRNA